MNRRVAILVVGLGIGVGIPTLGAQDQGQDSTAVDSATIRALADISTTSTRLARALPADYAKPPCFSGTKERQVKDAMESFETALESETIEGRAPGFEKARSTLLEAIKQDDNAAVWFVLGQLDLYQDDAIGADSALQRAATLAPGCRDVIGNLREMAWYPLVSGGTALARAGERDSALVLFRKADRLFSKSPLAAMNVGIILANTAQPDSAAVYLRRALSVAEAEGLTEERNQAAYNLGVVLQHAGHHAEAVTILKKYLQWVPDDIDTKNALAASYRAVGNVAQAQEIEKELLASVEVDDSGAVGGAGADRATPLATTIAMRAGIDAHREKRYADAAAAFRRVLELEPNNRNAIYNLADTYLALEEGPKAVEVGTRLLRIEPMSEDIHHILGSAYKMVGDIDQAIKVAEAMLALPADIVVKEFVIRAGEAQLTMTATGREAQTPEGKPIEPTPVELVFEFLDKDGAVVTSKGVTIPALRPPEQSGPAEARKITVEAKGKGIVAWRYSRK